MERALDRCESQGSRQGAELPSQKVGKRSVSPSTGRSRSSGVVDVQGRSIGLSERRPPVRCQPSTRKQDQIQVQIHLSRGAPALACGRHYLTGLVKGVNVRGGQGQGRERRLRYSARRACFEDRVSEPPCLPNTDHYGSPRQPAINDEDDDDDDNEMYEQR